jgi:hypothetical protein
MVKLSTRVIPDFPLTIDLGQALTGGVLSESIANIETSYSWPAAANSVTPSSTQQHG